MTGGHISFRFIAYLCTTLVFSVLEAASQEAGLPSSGVKGKAPAYIDVDGADSSVPPALSGQSATSFLQGKVLDASRSPIAGATIVATPDDHSAIFWTLSDQNGEFSLTPKAGGYTISVTAKGFLGALQTMNWPAAKSESHEFLLSVLGRQDTVTVTGRGGYQATVVSSATKTLTPLRDVPQAITVVTQEQIKDQLMMNIADLVRYVPGITAHQGENNRDQVIIRGNSSSADFFVNGVRDDVQYYRDLYNLDHVEALKGPNAMIFGRGGSGGVINRVTKEAGFTPLSEITLQGGSYSNKRFATDFDQPFNDKVAVRLNGVFEKSASFRDQVHLDRYGISPTLTISPWRQTKITLNYERFRDDRIADRGIPSYQGRPVDADMGTYFGNPEDSRVKARVNLGSAAIEHQMGRLSVSNRTLVGDYDRGYQNYVAGAVTADKLKVALSAYNNATQRRNLFNQTDLIYTLSTEGVRHTLLVGTEIGRQLTDNYRNTGYFNGTTTTLSVPYSTPTISTPATFRQSPTDADNHITANLAAAYIQDQIELSRRLQVVAGIRLDHFDLQYHNNRTGDNLRRTDNMVSPRAGIVFKPLIPLSLYLNYSVTHLPSSGDQFSSLTAITQQVKPERFNNYELGAKWDIARNLSLTTAAYRLDRTNTRATDPNDPTKILQTGSQRTNGCEIGFTGTVTRAWQIAGGYAYQDAFIVSATTAARAGAHVAQVPRHTYSLWNNYRFLPRLGGGLGISYRDDMFASVDNMVTLPGYTRADMAVYYSITEKVRLQMNAENVFNKRYYANADNNNNISPGSPRAIRIGLTARF